MKLETSGFLLVLILRVTDSSSPLSLQIFVFLVQRFRGSTNILQQLPHENIHVSFIVSLYSDEKGYSITLCPQGREGMVAR